MTRHTTNLLLMGSLLTISIGATAIADTLTEAVASYQSAMQSSDRQERINGFRRAELLFRKAIEDSGGAANGDLYANLGTACLSGEQIGPAIVAYRKALQLNPQHDQSRKNLTYARELLPSWARKSDSNSPLNIFRSNASARLLRHTAGVCFVACCLMFGSAIYWRLGFLRMLAVFPLVAWLTITIGLFALKSNAVEAVVIRDDVIARSADSHNSSQLFGGSLPSGAEVFVLEERGDWARISLADKSAWIPRSAMEIVAGS